MPATMPTPHTRSPWVAAVASAYGPPPDTPSTAKRSTSRSSMMPAASVATVVRVVGASVDPP